MKTIAKLSTGVAIGIIGHQTSFLFNKWDQRGRGIWVLLGRYAVGSIMIAIGTIPFTPEESGEETVKNILTASICVGAGVGAGYAIDELTARI